MANVMKEIKTIQELIQEADKSLAKIARETGLSLSHISRINSGDRTPSMETIRKLAPVLGVTPTCLFESISATDKAA